MSPTQGENLGGVALYNPHLLSKGELSTDFVARRADLERLVSDLRARIGATPQHHLILGQRGMGKSTLLRRVAYAVEDDAVLAGAYLPLVLPEEQYNVKHLTDLWLNCLDALTDTLEAQGQTDRVDALDALVESLPRGGDEASEHAARAALLAQAKQHGRRLLLLVDNLDLVLDRIRDQDWRLREVLQESDALVIVGASASALESTWDYGRAFYDFFRVHRLNGLTDAETTEVLVAIADRRHNPRVRDIALHHPERVKPVRLFAGGNPRTIAVLYEVLAAGPDNDLRAVLETLLDRYTPLYKARIEALAVQAQQVVDALCQCWDPATAATVAEASGIDVSKVSVQLDRLVTDGVVEKVEHRDAKTGEAKKKAAFQIAERLFNIWYLMRASRRARRRLGWLVRFLEAFEGEDGLASWAGAFAKQAWAGDEAKRSELALALLERVQGPAGAVLKRRLAREVVARPDLVAELGMAEGEYATERDDAARMAALQRRTTEIQARVQSLLREADQEVEPTIASDYLDSCIEPLSGKKEFVELLLGAQPGHAALACIGIALSASIARSAKADAPWMSELAPLVTAGCDWSSPDFADFVSAQLGVDSTTANARRDWLVRTSVAGRRLINVVLCAAFARDRQYEFDPRDFSPDLLVGAPPKSAPPIVLLSEAWTELMAGRHTQARLRLDQLATASDESFTRWLTMLSLLCILPVAFGLAAEARDLLDASGLTDRWRPMREALHARALGSPDVLMAVAPEVRDPARRLYDSWLNIVSVPRKR